MGFIFKSRNPFTFARIIFISQRTHFHEQITDSGFCLWRKMLENYFDLNFKFISFMQRRSLANTHSVYYCRGSSISGITRKKVLSSWLTANLHTSASEIASLIGISIFRRHTRSHELLISLFCANTDEAIKLIDIIASSPHTQAAERKILIKILWFRHLIYPIV